jgi:surfactin synthase thioesterase subunit
MNVINLFCLPFAGGSKFSYRKYEEIAPPHINMIPLEYPGRGARIRSPLITDVNLLTQDIYSQIEGMLNVGKYAIYGHSMGGLLGYLLSKEIVRRGQTPPVHIFITGTMGPSALARELKKRHLLEKEDFIEELKGLNGSPREILEDDDLLEYFEPILRADFKVSETYVYEKTDPLEIPFTVITGTDEDMNVVDIKLWQNESTLHVDFISMKGNHFFILDHSNEIVEIISKKLLYNLKSHFYERN